MCSIYKIQKWCSRLKNNFTTSEEEHIICSSRKIKSSVFKLLNWPSTLLSEHRTRRDTVELQRTVMQYPFSLSFFLFPIGNENYFAGLGMASFTIYDYFSFIISSFFTSLLLPKCYSLYIFVYFLATMKWSYMLRRQNWHIFLYCSRSKLIAELHFLIVLAKLVFIIISKK